MHQVQDLNARFRIGRCWLIIIRIRKEVLNELLTQLFEFFLQNFSVEQYEMNFTSAEFFLYLVDEEDEDIIKTDKVFNSLKASLKQ